jgi:chaperonin GroES
MTLKAITLYDRIIVKRSEEESVSAGGIVIPDTAKEKPSTGKVVGIGKGKLLMDGSVAAPLVKVGDVIMFGKFAGTEIKVGDDKLLVIREDDVLCVVIDE